MADPATSPASIEVCHSWADPPTAVCGQVGEYSSGEDANPRRSDRNRAIAPELDTTLRWLSKTPPGGTPWSILEIGPVDRCATRQRVVSIARQVGAANVAQPHN
jgi:hypothetical protein